MVNKPWKLKIVKGPAEIYKLILPKDIHLHKK